MDYKQLQQEIKQGVFHPVYLFFGPEGFVKERSLKKLCDALLDGGMAELNLTRFEQDASADEVAAALETVPAFAPRRVVVYADCPMLQKGGKDMGEKRLMDALEHMPAQSVLIFYLRGEADARRALYKRLAKECQVRFDILNESDIYAWLRADAKSRGVSMDQEAMSRMVYLIGKDMGAIAREMEKVYAYAYPRKEISRSDVDAICTQSVQAGAFDMLDDIVSRRFGKAMDKLDQMQRDGASVQEIIGAAAYRMRMLVCARELIDQKMPENKALGKIPGPRFAAKKAYLDAKKYALADLQHALCALAEADFAIKTGQKRDRIALEEALIGSFSKGERER